MRAQLAAGGRTAHAVRGDASAVRRPRRPTVSCSYNVKSFPSSKANRITLAAPRLSSVLSVTARVATPPSLPVRRGARTPPGDAQTKKGRPTSPWRELGTHPTKAVPAVRLLTSYDATVKVIVDEMDNTRAGDRIEFSVYVLEPGESTRRVLASMRAAAGRGVRVHASLDCSVISSFTRWCEGTATLADELLALEREFPERVRFTPQTIPTHAKYVMCHRGGGRKPTAVFGGINIGDRFKPWRDFAIRAEGKALVGALSLNVNGPMGAGVASGRRSRVDGDGSGGGGGGGGVAHSARELLRRGVALSVGSVNRVPASDRDARAGGVGFVTNRPSGFDVVAWAMPWLRSFPGIFNVRPALEALMADERYTSYHVAAAYLDQSGGRVLEQALERGADVTLVMPRNPNVYHDANRKALRKLVGKYGEGVGDIRPLPTAAGRRVGTLTPYFIDDMLHAKVFLAHGSGVDPAAMIGSCNLKQRSFGQFAELNALIVQSQCTRKLAGEFNRLVGESARVTADDLRFAEPKATIEEWLG